MAACWALASEMQRIHEEQDQATAQLPFMRASLQQMLPTESYLPGLWAAVGSQEEMAPLGDQSCHCQDTYSENLQDGRHQGGNRNHSPEQDPECPLEMTSLGNSSNHSKEEVSGRPQETDTLGDSSSYSWKEELVMLQGVVPLGDNSNHSQKEELVMP
ncbi:hypothetical protein GW7_19995 [Heterocephalus glaber]|uniref:Uncharacterized protein n=1 Tax=Heterocephalus glaber TaxID=10181 RepID=G5BCS0_HETGA|nr:hypothetical protein GW7_19995 [Heterocephalus glaber]